MAPIRANHLGVDTSHKGARQNRATPFKEVAIRVFPSGEKARWRK